MTATDTGNLSVSTSFDLTVDPALSVAAFGIMGVSTLSCTIISAGQRSLTFTPQYTGLSGQAITFRVVNELIPTTNPGPYTLRLYTDNPTITLKATQRGTAGEVSFVYHWLAACGSGSGRVGAEPPTSLQVQVLGNPVVGETVEVEVQGATSQHLRFASVDNQGRVLSEGHVEEAAPVERRTISLKGKAGVYLIRISTPIQQRVVKVLKL